MTTAAAHPGPPSPNDAYLHIPLDADGRLASEIACLQCGYLLRGLRPDDRCPECGEPAADSLRSDLLLFADPAWLARLSRGLKWLLAYALLMVAMAIAQVLLLTMLSAFLAVAGGSGAWEMLLWVGLQAIWAIPLAVAAVGVLMLTTPDPRRAAAVPASAGVARAGVVLAPALVLVTAVGTATDWSWTLGTPWSSHWIQQVGTLGVQAASAVWFAALFLVVASLARRLPNRPLTRQLRSVGWTLAILGGVSVTLSVAQTLYFTLAAPTTFQTATAPPPNLPAVQAPAPNPGAPAQPQQLPDGTTRTIFQENDPASPTPHGLTIVDEMPDGTHRTHTRSVLPSGDTLISEIVADPAGNTFSTTTTYDAAGAVLNQNTTSSNAGAFTGMAWIGVMIVNWIIALAYYAAVIWGIVLLVWFFRRLRDTRVAAKASAWRPVTPAVAAVGQPSSP